MPANRNKLPLPCPKCHAENGFVQFLMFDKKEEVYCRIGHYWSQGYLTAKAKSKEIGLPSEYNSVKDIRNGQRKWCCFKTHWYPRGFKEWYKKNQRSFRNSNFYCKNCNKKISFGVNKHRKESGHKVVQYKGSKSKTLPMYGKMYNLIKKYGWDRI